MHVAQLQGIDQGVYEGTKDPQMGANQDVTKNSVFYLLSIFMWYS